MNSDQGNDRKRRVTDTEPGRMCHTLGIITDVLRSKIRSHVEPQSEESGLKLLHSERDVNEMIEAHLGALFHHTFQLSGDEEQNYNTSSLSRNTSRERMHKLLGDYRLDNDYLNKSSIGNHLRRLRELITSYVCGNRGAAGDADSRRIWAGCHLWLEHRIATGFRLLFLEGQQWSSGDASWEISRVVHDWPSTFTRLVLGNPNVSAGAGCRAEGGDGARKASAAICAFRSLEEKEEFERISGFAEGEYLYLWTGEEDSTLSDFGEGDLVWFQDPGRFDDVNGLQQYPHRVLGTPDEIARRWSILSENLQQGLASVRARGRAIDVFALARYQYTEMLKRTAASLLEKQAAGKLPAAHWLNRCSSALGRVLGRDDVPVSECFWAIQSVMFYEWKYWYVFPFSYEGQPSGGLALSSTSPLTESQIEQLAVVSQLFLEMFAETEEWARNRLRQRREANLLTAAQRVNEQWALRSKEDSGIGAHKELFTHLLNTVFEAVDDVEEVGSTRPLKGEDRRRLYQQRTWREYQCRNVIYAVVNYWNELLKDPVTDRVFAPWLSSCLGETRYADWDKNWAEYSNITSEARKLDPPFFTLNDFLFDKAPRKTAVEIRVSGWQIVPRGPSTPAEWVTEPPSITQDVISLLGELEIRKTGDPLKVAELTGQIRARLSGMGVYLREHVRTLSRQLNQFRAAREKTSLGLYPGDVDCLTAVLRRLEDEVGPGEIDRSLISDGLTLSFSEYFVRLAVYLNVKLHTLKPDAPGDTFLTLPRCVFLVWTLYRYYHPNSLRPSQQFSDWRFYSIPVQVHIPSDRTSEVSRASIISLGTVEPLSKGKLILWRDIGKEMVFPAMMYDLKEEVKKEEFQRLRAGMAVGLYHQLGQVVASTRARVNQLIGVGNGLQSFLANAGRIGEADKAAFDRHISDLGSKWVNEQDVARDRLNRVKMFRDFAYAQLVGSVPSERRFASAVSVSREAMEVAKEYLSRAPKHVSVEFDATLGDIEINQDAYGFILQELLANAYRHSPAGSGWIRVSLIKDARVPLIAVRNAITSEMHDRLSRNPIRADKEPGPEQQSGRGLFGVYCLFQARGIDRAPEPGLSPPGDDFWLSMTVPVVDFYTEARKE